MNARPVERGGWRRECRRFAFVLLAGAGSLPGRLDGANQEGTPGASREHPEAPKSNAGPANAGPDPLGAATRELDALRQSRAQGATLPERSLPRFTVPDVKANAGVGPLPASDGSSPRSSNAPRMGHEPNWLIEAMTRGRDDEQRRNGRQGRGRAPLGVESSIREQGDEGRSDRMQSHDPSGPRRDVSGRPAEANSDVPATENPLDPFLASWMSPADYALLRPGVGTKGAGLSGAGDALGVARRADWTELIRGGGSIGQVDARSPSVAPGMPGGRAGGEPTNPFLAGLEGVSRPADTSGPVAFGGLAHGQSTADGERRMSAGPASAPLPGGISGPSLPATSDLRPGAPGRPVPDFAKPKTDEKLFKPLKRF